jgi:hypothetical protein
MRKMLREKNDASLLVVVLLSFFGHAVEKMPGKQRTRSGRKQGRQEQIMPVFDSTLDQIAAGGLS